MLKKNEVEKVFLKYNPWNVFSEKIQMSKITMNSKLDEEYD
jgi:hypothetical protein